MLPASSSASTKAGTDSTSSRCRRSERSSCSRRRSPLAIERRLLERAPGRVEQIGRRDRLENVGERRAPHGGDGALDRRVAGHHHRLQEGRAGAQRRRAATCRRRRAAARRSARRRSRARRPARARSRRSRAIIVSHAEGADDLGEVLRQRLVVVDDEDEAAHAGAPPAPATSSALRNGKYSRKPRRRCSPRARWCPRAPP